MSMYEYKIPERSVYRQSVEKWFNFINKTVTTTTDVRDII